MSANHASRRQRSFFFFLLSVLTGPEAPACGSRRSDLEDRLIALAVGAGIAVAMVVAFIYRKPLILGLIEAADWISK